MDHLRIIFYIIHLMLGAAVAFFVYQRAKTSRQAFLWPYFGFICFSNLIILISLVTMYTMVNMQGGPLVEFVTRYEAVCEALGGFFYLGMVYMLVRTILALKGRSFPRRWRSVVWVGIPFVAANLAMQVPDSYSDTMLQTLSMFMNGVLLVTVFLIFGFLVSLLLYTRKHCEAVASKVNGYFGWFYTAVYLVLIGLTAFQIKSLLWLNTTSLVLFNLFPFFWVSFVLKQPGYSVHDENFGEVPLKQVLDPYQVTRREQEIARLIMQGKRNKEIQAQLHISPHTVKNHIYSLYQKLGVKSRGQLIHSILVSRQQQSDDTAWRQQTGSG